MADSTFITWVNCFLQYMQFSMVLVALFAILFVFGNDFLTVLVYFHIYIYIHIYIYTYTGVLEVLVLVIVLVVIASNCEIIDLAKKT